VAPAPAPAPAPAQPEELAASWEELDKGNGAAPTPSAVPRAARKGPASSTRRVGGLPPATTAPYRLSWVIGIASIVVFVLVAVGAALAWVFSKKPDTVEQVPAGPPVYYVNRLGTNGAYSSIAAALAKVRQKGRPARIVVQEDLVESDVYVDVPNLSLEAEGGKTIHWKPSSTTRLSKLLLLNKAEAFHLKGFQMDGDNRMDCLINVYHHCPACRLEDVKLQNFKHYGIWIANCEGGEKQDRHVLLRRLNFVTTQPEQTALFFSIEPGARDAIPKNKFIDIRDCTFEGPGEKVKTPDLTTLEGVTFPAGVQPVQGGR
jgi:hypothetical protein